MSYETLDRFFPGAQRSMAEALSGPETDKIKQSEEAIAEAAKRTENFRVIGKVGTTTSEDPFRIIGRISKDEK